MSATHLYLTRYSEQGGLFLTMVRPKKLGDTFALPAQRILLGFWDVMPEVTFDNSPVRISLKQLARCVFTQLQATQK